VVFGAIQELEYEFSIPLLALVLVFTAYHVMSLQIRQGYVERTLYMVE
jgi:hypothetical protein